MLVLTLTFLLFKNRIFELFSSEPQTEPVSTETLPADSAPEDTTQAGIDLSSYTDVTLVNTAVNRGDLIIVDREHPYIFSQDDSFISLYDVGYGTDHFSLAGSGILLLKDAYDALRKMTDDYYAATGDESLMITSGIRTYDEQQVYYDNWVEGEEDAPYFELPGYSDHHTGSGFDVKIYDSAGASYSYSKYCLEKLPWIVEHYVEYGFIMRYPALKAEFTGITEEGNHFRYVGVPHSVYMAENGLCLEEYLELLKGYTLQTQTLKISTGGCDYEVYYVPAAPGESTDVPVPAYAVYTLSGNNIDGFIITVQ